MISKKQIALSALVAAMLAFTGCGSSGGGSDETPTDNTNTETPTDNTNTETPTDNTDNGTDTETPSTTASLFSGDAATTLEAKFNAQSDVVYPALAKETIANTISADTTLTSDKIWIIDGLVTVQDGATLTIEPGTVVAGKYGTADNSSYMVIAPGGKIIADGTADAPIIFTSEKAVDGEAPAVGQWGGLTLVGNAGNDQVKPYEVNEDFVAGTSDMADNSGVLRHVKILNSGITMAEDKEINGLSFVGVGSGTVVENITVDLSDDDGVELWGGTVNLSNITISRCTDDHFDFDDGYSGLVTNLVINNTMGNAGIEMSGNTAATIDGFNITMTDTAKEGGIYFKGSGIGGTLKNGTVTYMVEDNGYGAIHSNDVNIDAANTSFENVSLIVE